MSDLVTVKIIGLDQLQQRLEKLPRDVSKNILKSALKETAKELRSRIVAAAPKDTGFLSKHFNIGFKFIKGELAATASVGPSARAVYPSTRESGKTRREQGVGTGQNAKKGGYIPAKSVARFLEYGTSKMSAKPFIRPAFESFKDAALFMITEKLKVYINNWKG